MAQSLFSGTIRILDKLGEGSFADVFKVQFEGNPDVYAVKRLKKRFHAVDQVKRLPEILCLQALKGCPNIVDLIDVNYQASTGCVLLVFECLDQSICELLTDNTAIDERTALLYVYQMLKGLAAVHSKNLCHRDIKPENCMLNLRTYELKLIDFGSTRSFADAGPFTEYIATRWYRAPECLLTAGSYGAPIDVWAVGCILYELITGRPLFPGGDELTQIDLIHKLLGTPDNSILAKFMARPNGQLSYNFKPFPGSDFRGLIPTANEQTIDLLRDLLIYDPDKRITAEKSLAHPAFAHINEMERRWEKTDRSMAMPFFVKESMEHSLLPQKNMNKYPRPIGAPPLMSTRLKAAQRIKEYQRAEKPKIYFSLHTQKLLPILQPHPRAIFA
jgi:renal tumor antigen